MFTSQICRRACISKLFAPKRFQLYQINSQYFSNSLTSKKGTKETPASAEKIGARTSTLDHSWAKNPNVVIKNAHKLTEVEMMNLLSKVVTLPEKRLEKLLKAQGSADEDFIQNLTLRLPHFLTTTLVEIAKVLGKNHQIMKKSEIWDHLEIEILKRSSKFNNQQLADVLTSFSLAGRGSEKFFNSIEETIVDSPIMFDDNHLYKFMKAYTQLNYGGPTLYAYFSKMFIRNIDNLSITRISEICLLFSRSKNAIKAGFGFYHECEKQIKMKMASNKLSFEDGTKAIDNLFKSNIGSTDFQIQIEEYLDKRIEHESIPQLIELATAIHDPSYIIKNKKLRDDLYTALTLNMNDISVRQIETLYWALTRDKKLFESCLEDDSFSKMLVKSLLNNVFKKLASMKSRGITYIANGLKNVTNSGKLFKDIEFEFTQEEFIDRIEKTTLTKLNDFVNHDLILMLSCFSELKQGSSTFYEKLISRLIERRSELKTAEFIKLFQILPEFPHIYENNMNELLWKDFIECVSKPIYKKAMPAEELAKTLIIIVSQNFGKGDSKLFYNIINQIRGCIYQIPEDLFSMTLFCLIESHFTEVANKFLPIIEKLKETKQLLTVFKTKEDRIRILWSLCIIEKSSLINPNDLKQIVNEIQIKDLNPLHFRLFIQMLNMVLTHESLVTVVDFDSIYHQIGSLSFDYKQELINSDLSCNTSDQLRMEIRDDLDALLNDEMKDQKTDGSTWEVINNMVDDFHNCIDIACLRYDKSNNVIQKIAVILNNDKKYLGYSLDENEEPKLRMTENTKMVILENIYEWTVININENDSKELANAIKENVNNNME